MGFSQEMKDFLGAYKTGQSINASRTDQDYRETQTKVLGEKGERDNDPDRLKTADEQAKATLAATQQRMKLAGSARGDASLNAAKQREMADLRMDMIRNPQKYGGGQPGIGLPTSVGDTGPVLPGQGVVAGVSRPALDPDGNLDYGDPGSVGNPYRQAEGGLVPEDDEPDEGGGGALDIGEEVSAPTSDATDFSAQSRPRAPRGLEGVVSPQLIRDAAKAGMTYGLRQAGYGGAVPSSRTAANARLIAQGQGGLNEEEMQAARRTVDPEGKMTDSQRNMAALGSTYQFFANKGEPEKAQRVAFQMLQYYRNASQRYAAIAAKAAEGGNIDLATKAALKAYQNVPDGNDLEIGSDGKGGLVYSVTGPDGKTINSGVATPQQLAASAMGLATGGFDKAIMSAAGAQEDTGAVKPGKVAGTTAAGGRPQTAKDRGEEASMAVEGVKPLKDEWVKANEGKPVEEKFWAATEDAAQELMRSNKNLNARQAAMFARQLMTPGTAGSAQFKVEYGDKDGDPATITFDEGGLKVNMSPDQLDMIQNARAARIKEQATKEAADKKAASEPGFVSKAVDGVKTIAGAVSKDGDINPLKIVGKAVGRGVLNTLEGIYGEHIPESVKNMTLQDVIGHDTAQRGRVQVEKARDQVRRTFTNTGAIPIDDGDRPL